MNKGDVSDLTPDTVDEAKFGLGASVCLALVECFLCNFLFQNLWWLRLCQHSVLASREEAFEEILRKREPDNQFLPREERPVEEFGEAL